MKEIREWLDKGQDYAVGLALYESHGKSRVVLTALKRGASDFTRQKLREVLTKLLQENVHVVDASPKRVEKTANRVHVGLQVPSKYPASTPSPTPLPKERGEASPEVHQQRRAWFAERNYLHPQLELVASDAERLAMSLRILELGDLISQSYAAAPDLATSGPPPGHHLASVTDEGEMRRLLANLRPQRTKLKKRPDRATDLAQVESDIKLLEERLKRDGGEPKLH